MRNVPPSPYRRYCKRAPTPQLCTPLQILAKSWERRWCGKAPETGACQGISPQSASNGGGGFGSTLGGAGAGPRVAYPLYPDNRFSNCELLFMPPAPSLKISDHNCHNNLGYTHIHPNDLCFTRTRRQARGSRQVATMVIVDRLHTHRGLIRSTLRYRLSDHGWLTGAGS
jgi:hypothetical protein